MLAAAAHRSELAVKLWPVAGSLWID